MPDQSPAAKAAKASRRRFWRDGPPTPRQLEIEALARIAAAEEAADTQADLRNLIDPYDYVLARPADPQAVHIDKARRVHRGQLARRIKRRLKANRHHQAR